MSNNTTKEVLNHIAFGLKVAAAHLPPDKAKLIGQQFRAKTEMRQDKGPTVNATELAKIVDARLYREFREKEPSAKAIEKHILDALNLVERCQWQLHLRRQQWPERVESMAEYSLVRVPQSNREKAILEIDFSSPLDFHKGLDSIGVPGKERCDRERNYRKFFTSRYPYWKTNDLLAGGQLDMVGKVTQFLSEGMEKYNLALGEAAPVDEGEIEAAYDERKSQGWLCANGLLNIEFQFHRWWKNNLNLGKVEGGKKSGEVRRAKAEAKRLEEVAQNASGGSSPKKRK